MNLRATIAASISIYLSIASFNIAYGDEMSDEVPPYVRVQTAAEISTNTLVWSFFSTIAMLEEAGDSGIAIDLLREGVGLDDESANALKRYAIEVVRNARQQKLDVRREFCARKAEILTKSELAVALVEARETSRLQLDTAVFDVAGIIGGENQKKVYDWVNENIRQGTQVMALDHAAYFNQPHVDVDEVFTRICHEQQP